MDGQAGAELVAYDRLGLWVPHSRGKGSLLQLTTVWFLAKLTELQLFLTIYYSLNTIGFIITVLGEYP